MASGWSSACEDLVERWIVTSSELLLLQLRIKRDGRDNTSPDLYRTDLQHGGISLDRVCDRYRQLNRIVEKVMNRNRCVLFISKNRLILPIPELKRTITRVLQK